jgi:hypothetical protein
MNDLFEKELSSHDRIKKFWLSRCRVFNYEFVEHMKGHPGQLSWSQRVREVAAELRQEGYEVSVTRVRQGVYEYQAKRKDVPCVNSLV